MTAWPPFCRMPGPRFKGAEKDPLKVAKACSLEPASRMLGVGDGSADWQAHASLVTEGNLRKAENLSIVASQKDSKHGLRRSSLA